MKKESVKEPALKSCERACAKKLNLIQKECERVFDQFKIGLVEKAMDRRRGLLLAYSTSIFNGFAMHDPTFGSHEQIKRVFRIAQQMIEALEDAI